MAAGWHAIRVHLLVEPVHGSSHVILQHTAEHIEDVPVQQGGNRTPGVQVTHLAQLMPHLSKVVSSQAINEGLFGEQLL